MLLNQRRAATYLTSPTDASYTKRTFGTGGDGVPFKKAGLGKLLMVTAQVVTVALIGKILIAMEASKESIK